MDAYRPTNEAELSRQTKVSFALRTVVEISSTRSVASLLLPDQLDQAQLHMDRNMRERVSRKRKIPDTSSSNTSTTAPRHGTSSAPAKQRKKSSKNKKENRTQDANGFWGIKRIVKQEYRDGDIWYLVDWEDDEVTGESFPFEWRHHSDVTSDARAEWQKSWQKQPSNTSTVAASTSDHDPDSQPILPAKRRKLVSRAEIAAEEVRSRAARTGIQASSSQPVEQPASRREIPDSYEESAPVEPEAGQSEAREVRVEVGRPKDFESSEYAAVQETQPSPAEVASDLIPSSLSTPAFERPKGRPHKPKPFVWDEDIEEEIPDSQENESSSFKPSSGTVTSRPDYTAKNTQTNTEASLERIEFHDTQLVSSNSHSGLTESQLAAEPAREENIESSEPTSAQRSSSEKPSSQSGRYPSAQIRSPAGNLLSQSQPPEGPRSDWVVPDQLLPVNSVDSGEVEGRETASPVVDSPDPGDLEIRGIASPVVNRAQNQHPQLHSQFLRDSQLQAGASPARSTSHPTNSQASEVNLHGQPSSLPQSHFPRIGNSQDDSREINSPPGDTFLDLKPEASGIDQIDDTQKSSSSSGFRSQISTSSHLPSPPVEEVKQSIEQDEEATPVKSSQFKEPVSSPSSLPSRTGFFATMEPSIEPMAHPPPSDPTSRLKAIMAELRAKRASETAGTSMASISPSPAPSFRREGASIASLPVSSAAHLQNERAVAANQKVLAQTAEETSIPAVIQGSQIVEATSSESPPPPPLTRSPKASPEPRQPIIEQELVLEQESAVEHTLDSPPLNVLPLRKNEFDIPLPIVGLTRGIYVQVIEAHEAKLSFYRKNAGFYKSILAEISSLVDDLEKVCSHIGLLENDASQQAVSPAEQAKFAENVSTKAIFLAEFLPLLKESNEHIVILVRPGKMLTILQHLLLQHRIMHCRADQPGWKEKSTSRNLFRVTLYPTAIERFKVDPPSLVVAFDSTAQSAPQLRELRTSRSLDHPVPLFSLLVTNSIEHLERCFDSSLKPSDKNFKLLRCIIQLMDRVGDIDEAVYHSPPDAAKVAADFIRHGGAWPLLPMPEIEGLDLSLINSQSLSSEEPTASASETYSMSSSQVLQPGCKRDLATENSVETNPPKKRKLTPVLAESDNLRTSDTIPRSTPAGLDEPEDLDIEVLLKKVNDLESQLRSKDATELEILEINSDLESRCKDYEKSIASIQPKYQEALDERGSFEHECIQARARENSGQKQLDDKDAKIRKLLEKIESLEAELAAVQTALATSASPEAAEFARIKEELEQSKARELQLHKRLTAANNDLDYIRDSYQTASARAKETQSNYTTLVSENASYREKNKVDKMRIQEIQSANENAELRKSNKQLRARLGDLERATEKMSEELKTLTSGRRAVRGASAPKSMSPGPRQRILQLSSRGNSPTPRETGAGGNGYPTGAALSSGPSNLRNDNTSFS
ncbi:hypothetical protein LZ554_008758 [Drepanopeziza brunnea f. sp. 'monogermtubi']|nr:hypothetical protein LZ554_008758 [Drepanopeziza brunnea f. sp. 'monogermtubi']